ncbi:hypothetical protein [Magnetofaba australis]|uniref:SGNH hydrolase-type esterase domain-containing protein n=1 Tax=Magnetofaba australis IT-1 TaxID=1434232 RepID=A0A1Y2K1F3_9PROT|nr:hypothetical protein [Magnetofaba australis]OSM01507.1 hypothetical protein MAIT1_01493 [Magnetofaba australis IT-1]
MAIGISLSAALLLAEGAYRLWKGAPLWGVGDDAAQPRIDCGNRFDPDLGWKPLPGLKGINGEGAPVAIGADGLRRNEGGWDERSPAYLAVGDSYTFGDQVGDRESWPAYLETLLGQRVGNGGVCGYGVGQAGRRLQSLLQQDGAAPQGILFGVIPTDLWRTQAKAFYGRPKPYYSLENGQLAWHAEALNVGPPPTHPTETLSFMDRHSLLWRALPSPTALWEKIQTRIALQRGEAHANAHEQGPEVACAVIVEAARAAKQAGRTFHLIVQYKLKDVILRDKLERGATTADADQDAASVAAMSRVMSCVEEAETGADVLDSYPMLHKVWREQGMGAIAALYHDHMSAAGNRMTAQWIADHLRGEAAP